MRVVMRVEGLMALPGDIDIALRLTEASAFQGIRNASEARCQAIHIIHDHGRTTRHPFLHLGGDGLQRRRAITRHGALAILRGRDRGAVQDHLQAAFGPDMGHAKQAIDAGPIQDMGEFLRSPRQMQRLLIIIFSEEAVWRHWRQDIGQGHAHGALYQTSPALWEGAWAGRGTGNRALSGRK